MSIQSFQLDRDLFLWYLFSISFNANVIILQFKFQQWLGNRPALLLLGGSVLFTYAVLSLKGPIEHLNPNASCKNDKMIEGLFFVFLRLTPRCP